ncbi:putative uncharacterized transposon-derived protein F52C9.6 [Varanus komodoensis]|nr:putative uncharacterized transposon-derived protein F52C9.6 [Varanus komodoensis]
MSISGTLEKVTPSLRKELLLAPDRRFWQNMEPPSGTCSSTAGHAASEDHGVPFDGCFQAGDGGPPVRNPEAEGWTRQRSSSLLFEESENLPMQAQPANQASRLLHRKLPIRAARPSVEGVPAASSLRGEFTLPLAPALGEPQDPQEGLPWLLFRQELKTQLGEKAFCQATVVKGRGVPEGAPAAHCKDIEENNRIGKTRDLCKKIGDMKGTFHAKMGMIKDQNGRDLTEAEEIKKRWQDYTEELYKKELNAPDHHDGVVTDLESDILEWEVKWALGSLSNNKASGEHIMRKAGLDESPVGIKIAGRNINLRYADDTTLMAESEEELKSLLMQVKEESAKVGLKHNIKKTKTMASSPLTSWQIDGEEMEVVTDFIFLGSKITADEDYSQEIKRCLLLGRKAMANLDSILKSRDITLPTKVRMVKAMVFPVAMHGCESWTIRKAER